LSRNEEIMEVKYYSFKTGIQHSKKNTWRMIDIKIPAFSPQMAINLHYFISTRPNVMTSKYLPKTRRDYYKLPDLKNIFYTYRQVIEFEKLTRPKLGISRVQFKKLKTYSQNQILSWFSNEIGSKMSFKNTIQKSKKIFNNIND